MGLPLTDPNGVVQVTYAPPDAASSYVGGIGFASGAGALHVTDAISATDTWQAGRRRSNAGAVVRVDGTPERRPYQWVGGLPTSALQSEAGALITQSGQVPAPTDPWVAGMRVGAVGGVYTS